MNELNINWILASLGIVLLALEVFLGAKLFLFFVGISFLFSASLGLFFNFSPILLAGVFFISSVMMVFYWSHFIKNEKKSINDINTPLKSMKGLRGVVTKNEVMGHLKIKIGHTLWSARDQRGLSLEEGSVVEVLDIEDMILIVKEVN